MTHGDNDDADAVLLPAQEVQAVFTIFRNPPDYPGKWVVRLYLVQFQTVVTGPEPFCITSSLKKARRSLPRGLRLAPRGPGDGHTLIESWT